MSTKEETPRALRPHIGIFGKRNVGKSTLINRLTGQQVAIVSDVAGTTTDAVAKNMELPQVGACVLLDTAGYDDEGALGELRVESTRKTAEKVEVAVILYRDAPDALDKEWEALFRNRRIPVISIERNSPEAAPDTLRRKIAAVLAERAEVQDLTGSLTHPGDVVVLVMPQDIQAPKGRLILPQVQTIRHLLNKGCIPVCCTADRLEQTLASLQKAPQLIITDSQVFKVANDLCPKGTLLTSFSILMAHAKGDLSAFIRGAQVLKHLTEQSHVLIAEACTHVPTGEDIGRVKIPALLRKRIGQGINIHFVRGDDFPKKLSGYDLIIHCGACMFNRQHVLSRIAQAQGQGVPITNYGIVLAELQGVLPFVTFPEPLK
jgi:hypothetical protein